MELGQHVYSEKTQERLFAVFRLLIFFAAITFFINSVLGSIVRYYEAGGACLDWPTCLGQWLLPNSNGSVTVIWDYTHRLFTALSASLSILALILAKLIASKNAWIVRPLYLVFFLLTGQVLIGALLNIGWIESWRFLTSAIHLALSLVIQAAIVLAAIVAYSVRSANSKLSLFFRTPYAKFSLVTTFAVFILLVSGLLVSRLSANMQCIGWPICIPQNDASWIAFSHRIWVGITALMVTGLFIRSWQTQRSQATVLVAATAAFT
jgi:heme A synthase